MPGFGCLLDRHRVNWKDCSRGTRHNSAHRLIAENNKIIVVVVSSGQPVSIIQGGIDVQAVCEWEPVHQDFQPPSLWEWLKGE